MRCDYLSILFLAGMMPVLTSGQFAEVPSHARTNGQQSAAIEEPGPQIVGPDDPVITINGFCRDPLAQGSVCQTVVSRAQFDKLADALQPDMPFPLRLKVANAYARNLRMASAAEARDLDKTQAFEEEMHFARLQLLAQDLDRILRTEANNISDADFANYYEKNKSSFEQATVARIFVPHSSHIAAAANEAEKKAAADSMSQLATDVRARAVEGEDMDKLQIEVYAHAGIERTRVDTKLEKVRRATLPPQHESVMDLKSGEVSDVFSDPEGAHFIYKMLAKEKLTLEQAKPEMRSVLSTERYRDSIRAFEGNVVFTDAYFNPPVKSAKPTIRDHKTKTED